MHELPHESTAQTFCKLSTKADMDALMLKLVSRDLASQRDCSLTFGPVLALRAALPLRPSGGRQLAVLWAQPVRAEALDGSVMCVMSGLFVDAPCSELFGQLMAGRQR